MHADVALLPVATVALQKADRRDTEYRDGVLELLAQSVGPCFKIGARPTTDFDRDVQLSLERLNRLAQRLGTAIDVARVTQDAHDDGIARLINSARDAALHPYGSR